MANQAPPPPPTLQEQFVQFSKYGDPKSDGTTISLSQSDKWMKQANIFSNKGIGNTDTGIAFNKFKRRTINFQDYEKFLADLSKTKGADYNDLVNKLITCGAPGTTS